MVTLLLLATSLSRAPTIDSARIVRSVLVVEPLGVEITLPPAWIGGEDSATQLGSCDHHLRGSPERRFATTRPMLDSLRHAIGEWDREYSAVVDSVLPFQRLVAQLGPEPFNDGRCFADLQVRVYVLDSPSWAVAPPHGPSLDAGLRAARGFFPSATLASHDSASWQLDTIRWNAWYSDYGAEANVHIYSLPVHDRTMVLVFMRVSGSTAAQDERFIMDHVRVR